MKWRARKAVRRTVLVAAVVVLGGFAIKQIFDLRQDQATGSRASAPQQQSSAARSSNPAYPPALGDPSETNRVATAAPFTLPALPPALARIGSKSVRDALVKLGREASTGNPQAAYDAFTIASFCEQRQSLKAIAESFASAPNARDDETNATKAAYERVNRICGDLSPALLDERFAHIRMAAEAGIKHAADAYFLVGPHGIRPELLQQLRDDPSVVAWRDSSIALLTRDAQKGDLNAIGRLANIYSEDGIVQKNLTHALAYQMAATELQGRQDTPNKQWLQAMEKRRATTMAQQLSESERQAAQRMANELIKKAERSKQS